MRFSPTALIAAGFVLTAAAADAATLHAYVGAGLRPPVDELIATFAAETGNAVEAEYGGSGPLAARVEETGKGDIFLPGSTAFTEPLEKKGLIGGTRVLVLHGPVIAVHASKAEAIRTLADLGKPGIKVGIGDPQAMALGRTAEQILDRIPEGPAIRANVVVRAATVKQLATYVLDGNVDAAIVGAADAAQNPGKFTLVTIPPDLYQAERVPVAVIKASANPKEAEQFAAFLATDKALAVFARYGFPPAK
jgi:molybdate transport system substrate-binding protein